LDTKGKSDVQNDLGLHDTHGTFSLHFSTMLGRLREHLLSSTILSPSWHTNPLILIPSQVLVH